MIKLRSLAEALLEYNSIIESPMKLKQVMFKQFQNNADNYAFTYKIKEKLNNKPSDEFDGYIVYSYIVDDCKYDLFVDEPYTVAMFSYNINNKTILENKVWQDGSRLGLCRKIIFEYYLKKYDEIISDGIHSELGERYWKKMLLDASEMGYITRIVSNGDYKNIELTDLDKYFSSNPKFADIRFSISKNI